MSDFDVKTFLANLTTRPGIYQFIDQHGEVIYVGKARNLKKRVTSYFQRAATDTKTQALRQQINNVTVTITHSENEALLLESNLIKKIKPRYNIILRDDKSYPYLYLTDHIDFPRLDIYRGAKNLPGLYFGPFPSAGAVRETLALLQKIFKIRQCSDHFFRLRTRPCLQYFIDRCTAPCVGYVDVETYQRNVHLAVLFLEGKNDQVIEELAKKMEEASVQQKYEDAARYRDQIVSLRRIQEKQYVTGESGDVDVIAVKEKMNHAAIQVMVVRGGRLIGTRSYFPQVPPNSSTDEVLSAFLPQYYLDPARGDVIPRWVITNLKLKEQNWIADALSEQLHRKIGIINTVRGLQKKWLDLANTNAEQALNTHLADKVNFYNRLQALQTSLNIPNLPQLIECFDVSHTMGEATVASCVVFNQEGAAKKYYRRYNIKNVTPGDDYAALTQTLTRRYTKAKMLGNQLPDILMIDGGKGQLALAENVLEELQISGVTLLAIAKGPGRKPGLETIYISGREEPLELEPNSTALLVLQQIRDEAHRFAIVGHRKQRAKARTTSPLEAIPGIGAKRRRQLLRQMGGMQEIMRASVEDIANVPGINRELAERIFAALHGK